jgi:peptidoglycan-associated lipoprotein
MNKRHLFSLITLMILANGMTSCCRSTDEFVDDTKTASRHVRRGFSALGGKHCDSKQIHCRDDFYSSRDSCYQSDFVPLDEIDFGDDVAMGDFDFGTPMFSPGDPGSPVPSIEAFRDPKNMPEIAQVFRTIHFGYDSSQVKGDENLSIVRKAASYMRTHPNVYIFIEGHCDQRGPEAYNLALGARRSNAVRSLFIQEGANPERIYTISYGKERPLVAGNGEDSWAKNRRAEFRIYVQ